MIRKYYTELAEGISPRENLSRIRSGIKDAEAKREFSEMAGDGSVLIGCLSSDDAKTRKNAALLIGDIGLQSALDDLYEAYMREETRFVKSSYLEAIGELDATEFIPQLKERLEELSVMTPSEEERKHHGEELRALRAVIIAATGIERHTFKAASGEYRVVLTTYKELRNVLIDEIADVCSDKVCDIKPYPLGVVMRTTDIEGLTVLRTFREMLFLLGKGYLEADPAAAALGVWKTELLEILESFHAEEAPFYFRVDMKSSLKLDKKSLFTRRFAETLENISGGRLINSTSDYEAEIRLVETKDGRFVPLLKLYTIPMDRFSYRTGQTAGSMHPFLAASLARLARPYLKENAQILDPFCGVGTMLIERDILIPAGDKYGIDMFGEAIAKARENAAAADKNINFINRNYFDFKHDYLFDEIITDFPLRGKMTTGELDELYGSFFVKSAELLKNGGILILFSCEEGRIKKQLRLHKEYSLLQESCVRGKEQFNLFIIRYSK